MKRGYAVVTAKEETILFQNDSFRKEDVREKIFLNDDTQLWISGEDERYEDAMKLLDEARQENQAKETFLSNM